MLSLTVTIIQNLFGLNVSGFILLLTSRVLILIILQRTVTSNSYIFVIFTNYFSIFAQDLVDKHDIDLLVVVVD